ncbi:MAG: Arabinose efflux permease [Pelotomaculum thermopropionicum]|uniref:Arabinose efflux permease n=1 Tax=Pelotomaculum thermopropionicum TaxID=110500 RepID=A0A117M357_9FIRM|nr:MAG: Arabinose efflux permease [Pelotomaculum thermopropionicum]
MKLPFAVLCAVPFIMVLGNSMLVPLLPLMRTTLNVSLVQVTLLITAFSLPAGLVIPFAGFLSDYYGRKVIMAPALIIYGLGGILAGLAACLVTSPYYLILGSRILQGIGAAGTAPIAMALCGDLYSGKNRSRSLGVIESSNGLGKVFSPVIGSAIGIIVWYAAFIFFPVIIIPVVIAMWLLVKEPKTSRNEQSLHQYLLSISNILKIKTGLLFSSYLAGAIALMILFGVLFYLSEYLEKQFGLNGIPKGLALAVPVFFMSTTSFLTGFMIKRKKFLMKVLVITGLLLMTFSLVFLPLVKNVIIYFTAISFVGVGTGIILPCLNTLITGAASIEERGLVTSLYGSVRFLGVAFGPPLFGFLMARSVGMMFWSSAGLTLMAAVFVFIYLKLPKEDVGTEESEKKRGLILIPEPVQKPGKETK